MQVEIGNVKQASLGFGAEASFQAVALGRAGITVNDGLDQCPKFAVSLWLRRA